MHKNFFTFKPSHLLVMFTNHEPVINDDSEAVWRRIRLIPFDVTIPEGHRDPKLGERLLAEADALLAWIVNGHCQLEQSECDFRRFASAIHQVACDV